MRVTLDECHTIFRNTRGQSNNIFWQKNRKKILTASKFGKEINRKTAYTDFFVNSIGNPVDISHVPQVRYGKENEEVVAEKYKEMMKANGKPVEPFEVGLCINPSLPHLGASLDKGVYDPSAPPGEKYGSLEIKTCSKAGTLGLSVLEAVDNPTIKDYFLEKGENDKHLKPTQQLLLSNPRSAGFVHFIMDRLCCFFWSW